MDTANLLEFVLLIMAVLGAVIGPVKLRQLRKQLEETFARAEELQERLVLAREAMHDLEKENIELTSLAWEAGVVVTQGPDM